MFFSLHLPFGWFYLFGRWLFCIRSFGACEHCRAGNAYTYSVVVVVRKIAPRNYLPFRWRWRVHVKWNNVCAHIFLTLWFFRYFARVFAACLLLPPHTLTPSPLDYDTWQLPTSNRCVGGTSRFTFFFSSNIWLKSLFWHSTRERKKTVSVSVECGM